MHWIQNFINYSQVSYPNIFKTPLSVMNHLLFVIGNGIQYSNKYGNFCEHASMEKTAYHNKFNSEIQNDGLMFCKLLDIDSKYPLNFTEQWANMMLMYPDMTVIEFTEKLRSQELSIINSYIDIVEFMECDIFDYDWKHDIKSEKFDFARHYSSTYSKVNALNGNTNPDLLRVVISILDTYIKSGLYKKDVYLLSDIKDHVETFYAEAIKNKD
jgi:hypothetical protein